MKQKTQKNIIIAIWSIVGIGVGAVLLLFLSILLFADIPSFEELENPEEGLATQLISEDGKVLSTIHKDNRLYVDYNELSPYLIQAVIATEDLRFYKHSGIDYPSLARVLVKTLFLGDLSQGGGSTITQQLAKTRYPRNGQNVVWVKLKEWITAVKLERSYSKDEILTMYMNAVAFSGNTAGVRAAAESFFGKHPKDLTIEESAMLVGMVNKPSRYNPHVHMEQAKQRRDFVISQMEKADFITKEVRDSVQQIPINLTYTRLDHNAGIGLYFRDMLLRTMNRDEPVRKHYNVYEDYRADSLAWANDPLYGWVNKNFKPDGTKYNLYTDGLRIHTTLDSRMQRYAEEAVAEHLGKDLQKSFWRDLRYKTHKPFSNDIPKATRDQILKQAMRISGRYHSLKKAGMSEKEIQENFNTKVQMRVFAWNDKGYIDTLMTPKDSILYYKSHLRAGFMAIEPGTGHVKAYVGGPNYRYLKYDNLSQGKRQIGSTIKPFLYTLAMQEGMTPEDEVANVPQTWVVNGTTWTPKSTDRKEWIGQMVTLKWGLSKSSNNISAYLMKQFGPHAMAEMMRKMGISSHIEEVPALCVGAAESSVREMVSAYNTFPSKGVHIAPLYVTRIEDVQGNLLSEFVPDRREAISERTAYLMANLMQGVIDHGTGIRLRAKYKFEGQIAGKTGTTNNQADGWFIGYTPEITAGVWVGGEDPQIHFQSLALGGGSNMALPIWALFMKKVYADQTLPIKGKRTFAAPYGYELPVEKDIAAGEDAEGTEEMVPGEDAGMVVEEEFTEDIFN